MAHVLIGGFFSRCSECGGNADPNEGEHIHGGRRSGSISTVTETNSTLRDTNGCGVVFDEPAVRDYSL